MTRTQFVKWTQHMRQEWTKLDELPNFVKNFTAWDNKTLALWDRLIKQLEDNPDIAYCKEAYDMLQQVGSDTKKIRIIALLISLGLAGYIWFGTDMGILSKLALHILSDCTIQKVAHGVANRNFRKKMTRVVEGNGFVMYAEVVE